MRLCHASGSVDNKCTLQQGGSGSEVISQWIYQMYIWRGVWGGAFPIPIAFFLKLQQKQSLKNPFHALLSRHQSVPRRTSQLFKSHSGPGGIPLLHHHSGPSICFPPFILFSGLSYRALALFWKGASAI